jgi:hypothetical protein
MADDALMADDAIFAPALLTKSHEIASFDCGKAPLNDFLVTYRKPKD